MGVGEFFAILIMIGVFYVICKLPEWKADRRTPPPGMKTNYTKMSTDICANGVSKTQAYQNLLDGKYDEPIEKKK